MLANTHKTLGWFLVAHIYQAWWCAPVILILRRWRQEDQPDLRGHSWLHDLGQPGLHGILCQRKKEYDDLGKKKTLKFRSQITCPVSIVLTQQRSRAFTSLFRLQTSLSAPLSAEVPSQGLLTSLLCFPGISQGDFLPDLNSARRVYELLPVVLGHVKVKAMNKLGSWHSCWWPIFTTFRSTFLSKESRSSETASFS